MSPAEKRSVIDNGPYPTPAQNGDRAKSYQITLPKHWMRRHDWPTCVYISEQADGTLRIEAGRE